jgi:hypothetical protein
MTKTIKGQVVDNLIATLLEPRGYEVIAVDSDRRSYLLLIREGKKILVAGNRHAQAPGQSPNCVITDSYLDSLEEFSTKLDAEPCVAVLVRERLGTMMLVMVMLADLRRAAEDPAEVWASEASNNRSGGIYLHYVRNRSRAREALLRSPVVTSVELPEGFSNLGVLA